jgi:hypothetical protein
MPLRKLLAVTAIILCSALAPAKDKKKAVLPADVLHARTVLDRKISRQSPSSC